MTLDDDLYAGVPELFDDLRLIVSEKVGMSIEFFVVSSGLEDVMRGSEIVQEYFQACTGVCWPETRTMGRSGTSGER